MELLLLAAVIAVFVVCVAGIISLVKYISDLYRDRFRFSIWSGVFLFLLSVSLLIIAAYAGDEMTVLVLELVAVVLFGLVIYHDIRLAGFGWGTLAVGLQLLFAVSFLFLLVFLIIGYFIRSIFGPRRYGFFPSIGVGLGMSGELAFFLHFLHL